MINQYTYILFLLIASQIDLHAEELPWFCLYGNLSNANLILQGEIKDKTGDIEIHRVFKGEVKEFKSNEIPFKSPSNFKYLDNRQDLTGQKFIIFVRIDSFGKCIPSFWGWDTSILWLKDGIWNGVGQIDIGYIFLFGYTLKEIKVSIKEWDQLEQIINNSDQFEDSQKRLSYLERIFEWHPLKDKIIVKILESGINARTTLETLIEKALNKKYLTKNDYFYCMHSMEIMNFEGHLISGYVNLVNDKPLDKNNIWSNIINEVV